jgi:hypothetical protein
MPQQFFALPDIFQLARDRHLFADATGSDMEIVVESTLSGFRKCVANADKEFLMMEKFIAFRYSSEFGLTHIFQTSPDILRANIVKELIERPSTDLVSLSDPEIARRFEAMNRDPVLVRVLRQTIADHGASRWMSLLEPLCIDQSLSDQLAIPLHIQTTLEELEGSALFRVGNFVPVSKTSAVFRLGNRAPATEAESQ